MKGENSKSIRIVSDKNLKKESKCIKTLDTNEQFTHGKYKTLRMVMQTQYLYLY